MPSCQIKRFLSLSFLTAVLLVVGALPVGAQPQISPEAAQLLDKVAAKYQGLDAYADMTRAILHIDVPGHTDDMMETAHFSFKRPGLFSFATDNPRSVAVVAEATQTYSYFRQFNRYLVQERWAEDTIPEMATANGLLADAQLLIPRLLFSQNPNTELLKDVTSARIVGTTDVDGLELIQLETVIIGGPDGKTEIIRDLLIGRDDLLVHGVFFNMDKVAEKASKNPLADLFSKKSESQVRVILKAAQIITDDRVTPEDLRFKAPAGAQGYSTFEAMLGEAAPAEHKLVGKLAPDFKLQDLEGNTHTINDFRGKVVMMDFWATWCGPCKMAMPDLAAIAERFKDKPFQFLAVNTEDPETAEEFLKQQSYKLPLVLIDERANQLAQPYGIEGFPTMFLIDQNGMVRSAHSGYNPFGKKSLAADIQSLLDGKPLVSEQQQAATPAAEAAAGLPLGIGQP